LRVCRLPYHEILVAESGVDAKIKKFDLSRISVLP
jgi:hypothetical protein